MTKMEWKPVGFVVCSAVLVMLTSGCQSSSSEDAWMGRTSSVKTSRALKGAAQTGSDISGRGCPIPHDPDGEAGLPEVGKFIEMYAPHGATESTTADAVGASITITPRGADAKMEISGAAAVVLEKNTTYKLKFETDEKGKASYALFDPEIKTDPTMIAIATAKLRHSKGKAIDGYLFPGVTIYETNGHTIKFGLRVNGWSLPVVISQT